MILTLRKSASKEKVEIALSKIKNRKKFNAKKHLGKLLFQIDGLAYQKKARNEWR